MAANKRTKSEKDEEENTGLPGGAPWSKKDGEDPAPEKDQEPEKDERSENPDNNPDVPEEDAGGELTEDERKANMPIGVPVDDQQKVLANARERWKREHEQRAEADEEEAEVRRRVRKQVRRERGRQ